MTQLIDAIIAGNTPLAIGLIENGANIDDAAENIHGDTALTLASRCGHTEIAQTLIANGANIHDTNKYGDTALILALIYGNTEIAKTLIANGANINDAENIQGDTALILASYKGYTEIAQALIANGANINDANKFGITALICAVRYGHTEIAQAIKSAVQLRSFNAMYNRTVRCWAAAIQAKLKMTSEPGYAEVVELSNGVFFARPIWNGSMESKDAMSLFGMLPFDLYNDAELDIYNTKAIEGIEILANLPRELQHKVLVHKFEIESKALRQKNEFLPRIEEIKHQDAEGALDSRNKQADKKTKSKRSKCKAPSCSIM
jgi:predicted nucleic-acid-binding Zn-ribbon protein